MNIRPLLFASFVSLASLAAAQDAGKKVTFSAPASMAKNLLPELSKAAGVALTTSPQTSDEVLLVDVKDVPLDELLKRIAHASGAEWREESGGYRLIRSQALANQQERDYYADRAAKIKAEQAKIADELSKIKPATAADVARIVEAQKRAAEEVQRAIAEGRQPAAANFDRSAMGANPANRLLLSLLTALNSNDLARLEMGTRVVLSSAPTRMQRPLPNAGRAINDFVNEYGVWLKASQPSGQPETEGVRVSFGFNPVAMQGGLGKILLILSRNTFSPALTAELRIADQEGNIVSRQTRQINVEAGRLAPPANSAPADSPAATEKAIELSALAKEHAAFMNQAPQRGGPSITFAAGAPLPAGRPGQAAATRSISITTEAPAVGGAAGAGAPARLPVSAEWAGRLASPDKNEPLAFAVGELFTGYARQRGKNLVASFTDSILVPFSTRAQQAVMPAHFAEIVQNQSDMKLEEDGGWIVALPKFHAHARAVRVDRDELARLLTGIRREGRLSLDSLSRYALSRPNPAPQPALDFRYVSVLSPQAFTEFSQAPTNWRTLQLYATMTGAARQNLAAGGTLSLGALAPNQRAIVQSLVFDDMMGPLLQREQNSGQPANRTSTEFAFATGGGQTMRFGSGFSEKIGDERTEFLPNGLPPAGVMTLTVNSQEAVYATTKDGRGEPRFFTADTYAMYMNLSTNVQMVGGGSPPAFPQYDTFRGATMQTLDFHFQLLPNATLDRQLRDAWFQANGRDLSFAELPEAFRKRTAEIMDQMKNTRANIAIGAPGVARQRPPA